MRKTNDGRRLDFQVDPEFSSLREGTAISNLDGRLWGEAGADTGRYFGDEAMVRARVGIEARYLIALSQIGIIRKLRQTEIETLLELHQKITPKVYDKIREIESESRHDLVAVTMMFKELLMGTSLRDVIQHGWVHWGLTTWDIDNPARSCLITSFIEEVYLQKAGELLDTIAQVSDRTKDIVIPGKTHLQPAAPTVLGKEIALFGVRIGEALLEIKNLKQRGKLTGAVGNLSAHRASYPKINWRKFSQDFIQSLGLEASIFTTQIETRNKRVELLQRLQLVNSILVDLSQDMRIMIGFDWLAQEVKSAEFGSSAMPQKVNPIDFENSAGNAMLANWIFEGLSAQLPISWLQRDLVDKTIQRNFGLPFGHSLIALISATKGLNRVFPNRKKIEDDLQKDWSVVAEGFQTLLRARGHGDAYDTLKELTRGKQLQKADVDLWISNLDVEKEIKKEMQKINPKSYIGYAKESAEVMIGEIRKFTKSLDYEQN